MAKVKPLVFACWCLLLASAMAARGVDDAFGGRKDYYPPGPTDPGHSPPYSPTIPSCSPTPSHGGGTVPTTPSSPHGGGSCYPPAPSIGNPPPMVPPTPTVPLPPPTPYVPVVPTPPTTPTPYPPFLPGTCDFWRTHLDAIWALFGFWCPLGRLFGASAALPFGRDLAVPEALANMRADGVGELYREGTASLLNSMVSREFPLTTQQVKDAFGAALGSGDSGAAAQAHVFKKANEGYAKH